MIYDSQGHGLRADVDYEKLEICLDRFRKAIAENGTEPGKWQIEGDRFRYFISEYTTKPLEQTLIEGHREFLDVQYVLEGAEVIGCSLLDDTRVVTEDRSGQDAWMFADAPGEAFVTLTAGQYLVLFPWDLHRPGLCAGKPSVVKKAVAKIAMALVTR